MNRIGDYGGPMATLRKWVIGASVFLCYASMIFSPTGCAGRRLQPEDWPEEPIAFIHWADKAGQKRADIFAAVGEIPALPPDPIDPERFEELQVRGYLRGDEIIPIREKLSKYPGTMMLIWPRTGRMERIEAAPYDALPLAWSPDRRRLLMTSSHRGGREQLYEYHLERKDLSPITSGWLDHARGRYDADGQVITHQIKRVAQIGVSENTLHRVTAGGEIGPILATQIAPGSFALGPGNAQVIYEQVRLRPRRNGATVLESWIASQAMTGGGEEALLAKGREPTLTPDGRWIVFASPTAAGYRLRRMRLDGTSRVPMGPGGAEERMPTVSPDGEFVAFSHQVHGRRRLTIRRFDGKDERALLTSGWSEYPVW
jgi:hypothetical protein